MNLEELRKAMASDATKENKELKDQLAKMKKKLAEVKNDMYDMQHKVSRLEDDCRALCNRCYVMTKGLCCVYCRLNEYRCDHSLTLDEMIKLGEKMREAGIGDAD